MTEIVALIIVELFSAQISAVCLSSARSGAFMRPFLSQVIILQVNGFNFKLFALEL